MIKIEIYTDGSCNQKLQIGGWSYIILENGEEKIEETGSESETTNNKCEMIPVIKSFHSLEKIEFFESISVNIYSDSAYLVNAFNDGWISVWEKNGWLTALKKPVLNKDLWEKLIFFQKKYNSKFIQIKRLSNDFAKRVDELAKNSNQINAT